MSSRTKLFLMSLKVIALVVGIVRIGAADPPPPPPSAAFGLYAQTSTVLAIAPTHNPGDTFFKYTYTLPSGFALNDTIPFLVCLDNSTGATNGDWSDEITADNPAGAFSADVNVTSPPWLFNQSSVVASTHTSSDPGCQAGTVTISIPAGTLVVPGGYNTNVHFKLQNGTPSAGNGKLSDSFSEEKDIKIFVNVTGAQETNRIFCFITDSDGEFLQKCDGSLANTSGETDGTFAITANKKKIEVSTNPGQFYYNLLWNNTTGSEQTVNVNINALNGLGPHGTQALHWLTFLTSSFGGVNPTDFGQVIEGNPAGATGPMTGISVADGHTLYVTYHLESTGVGGAVPPNCGIGCANANQVVSVSATVSGTFGADECTAGAVGYLKQ